MADVSGTGGGTGEPGSGSASPLPSSALTGPGGAPWSGVGARADGAAPVPSSGRSDAQIPPAGLAEAESPDVADLHEYSMSLGVDADQDEDLLWVVQEAFDAPLRGSWAEYTNAEGRVYYFHEASSKSTWEHPMDGVYRELLGVVRKVRAEAPIEQEKKRVALIREHLQEVHRRAKGELQVWSGPYASEEGDYYYNEGLKASTWECPVAGWERELALRHAVLSRCLLPGRAGPAGGAAGAGRGGGTAAGSSSPAGGAVSLAEHPELLQALKLPLALGLARRESHSGDAPEPSTTRSFYTARSVASTTRSSRSKRGIRAPRDRGEERSSRASRPARERKSSEEQAEAPAPAPRVFHTVD